MSGLFTQPDVRKLQENERYFLLLLSDLIDRYGVNGEWLTFNMDKIATMPEPDLVWERSEVYRSVTVRKKR